MTTVLAIVVSFLGGSAVGAVLNGWFTSTERARERMIAAADGFLAAVEEARTAGWTVSLAAHEMLEAKQDADVFFPAAAKQMEAISQMPTPPEADPIVPESYARALRLMSRFVETPAFPNPMDIHGRAEGALLLEEAQGVLAGLDDGEPGYGTLAPLLRATIRRQARVLTAFQGRSDANPALHSALHRVHGAVARVTLTFPASNGTVSEVAERAETVKQLLLARETAINEAMADEADPLSAVGVTSMEQAANDAQTAFAFLANQEIAKSRWPWKKYG